MTIVLGALAVALAGAFGVACWLLAKMHAAAVDADKAIESLTADLDDANGLAKRAEAELDQARESWSAALAEARGDQARVREQADEQITGLARRLAEVDAERAQAQRDGERAAMASMAILASERAGFLESLTRWQLLTYAALLLGRQDRALPSAERKAIEPPQPLASGDFLAVDEDGPVILQLDDFELLPAGTNGTRA